MEFTGDVLAEPVNGYYSYLHSNVIMSIDVYCHRDIIDKMT